MFWIYNLCLTTPRLSPATLTTSFWIRKWSLQLRFSLDFSVVLKQTYIFKTKENLWNVNSFAHFAVLVTFLKKLFWPKTSSWFLTKNSSLFKSCELKNGGKQNNVFLSQKSPIYNSGWSHSKAFPFLQTSFVLFQMIFHLFFFKNIFLVLSGKRKARKMKTE